MNYRLLEMPPTKQEEKQQHMGGDELHHELHTSSPQRLFALATGNWIVICWDTIITRSCLGEEAINKLICEWVRDVCGQWAERVREKEDFQGLPDKQTPEMNAIVDN